jgi:large subunit ribosomal protein L4|tara:strand:+ start:3119 stop:3754 length:636 start_codon:yes stop_codon:yes gene_type:complete
MVIKTFEYTLLDESGATSGEKKSFSLDVAEKAVYVVHRAVKTATKNRSQLTSSTKTRAEVSGGGRKPYKQKGTGRARAGSTRSPLWKGGGVTFGPKPRAVYKKINKKEKQLALRTLIYNRQENMSIFKEIELEGPKTKDFINKLVLKNSEEKTLVISSKPNQNLKLSLRNLKNFNYILANHLNVTDLTKSTQIIMDESALKIIEETYCDKN